MLELGVPTAVTSAPPTKMPVVVKTCPEIEKALPHEHWAGTLGSGTKVWGGVGHE